MDDWDKDFDSLNNRSKFLVNNYSLKNIHTSHLKYDYNVMRSDDAAWAGYMPAVYKYGPVFNVHIIKPFNDW